MMRIFSSIEEFSTDQQPVILTIGNFDGVHLGHQFILEHMKRLAGPKGHTIVITFRNHPSTILRPQHPTCLLNTLAHKIKLLEQTNIDSLLILPFTLELAEQTAEQFIRSLRSFIPFSYLILGHDATLGKNKQGNQLVMKQLSKQLHFEIHYAEEYRHEGYPISSSEIRKHLLEGHLSEVERLLGRPYSIYSTVLHGDGKGKNIGYPTINLSTEGLCLPPLGVYAVTVNDGKSSFFGIANLGFAPTMKNRQTPLLESHLFSCNQDLYGKEVEVIFHTFIRKEQLFHSIPDLKQQIEEDIKAAKKIFQKQCTT